MDEIKDKLLDGEDVLWSGRPVVTDRRGPSKIVRNKLKHVAWMLFFALVAVYLFYVGNYPSQTGFVQAISGVVIVIIGIGLLIATIALLNTDSQAHPQRRQLYAVTNKRVLIVDTDGHWRQNILGRSIVGLRVSKNGNEKDIQIDHGNDDYTLMSALPDADVVERLLIENFAAKKEPL